VKELVSISRVDELCLKIGEFQILREKYPATTFMNSIPAPTCMDGFHSDKPVFHFTTHRAVTYTGIEGAKGRRGIQFFNQVAVSPCRPHPNPNSHPYPYPYPYPYPNPNSNTEETGESMTLTYDGNCCVVATLELLTDRSVVHRHFSIVEGQPEV